MEKITEWLTSKFQHPLSPLFFVFGALLILLGVSTGFNIPALSQITSDPNFRWASLIIGCICCIIAILLYYRPPKSSQQSMSGSNVISLAEELTLNFNGRRATLSETQGEILNFIVKNGFDGAYISQDTLTSKFNQYSKGELLYRLEHLRLLGFLERQKFGKDKDGDDHMTYRLSSTYQKELGNPEVIRKVSISGNVFLGKDRIEIREKK